MKPYIDGTFMVLGWCYMLVMTSICTAANTINTSQYLRDGESLVSSDGSFKLGFLDGSSSGRYLGIWYNKLSVRTVVWVANRNLPLTDSSGALKLTNQGILALLDGKGSIIWSANSSRPARNPIAQLQDSGNLVVKEDGEDNQENFIWQSFDYPSDTLMPGMKFGINRNDGFHRYLTSWKSEDDPSLGNFTFVVDPEGYPEFFVKEGSIKRFRLGVWNGVHFSGKTNLRPNPIYNYEFVYSENEIYYIYRLKNNSRLTRLVINPNGYLQRFIWIDSKQDWQLYYTVQIDDCDQYALCGSYSICIINNSPICSCLKGFEPKNPKEWDMLDWSSGCVWKTPLNCSTDGFQKYPGIKLPDTHNSWSSNITNLDECRNMCQENCSCTAYANLDVRNGGSGCLLWFGELIDIRQLSQDEQDQDLYIRMSAYDLEGENTSNKKKSVKIVAISLLSFGMVLVLALVAYIWKMKQWGRTITSIHKRTSNHKLQSEDLELPLFDFATISIATGNFAPCNKLGEGGFGPVYKGALNDGQEIAVKRLSKSSQQGLDEFKNEVMHISRLQHRNLVKLLGCCIQRNEKMLIYEFMPNKSLDFFIFGLESPRSLFIKLNLEIQQFQLIRNFGKKTKGLIRLTNSADQAHNRLFDWSTCYNIICGIARGLLYLHQDSRFRIIHRDIKAENILLDHEMNPKISDFGIARSFGGHENEKNTKKVVGTFGYISPEYASKGFYSTKSDIFSFGVIILEMISGKRNRTFRHPDHRFNLLGHAWILFRENRTLDLVPEAARDSCNTLEVLRSIQIGLLCVQSNAQERPRMSDVVMMLSGECALPQPKQPGFFGESDTNNESSSSSHIHEPCSNEMSITVLEAR